VGIYRAILPDGKVVFIAWAENAATTNLDLPIFCAGRIRVTDLQGRQRELNTHGLKIDSHPILVEAVN
jgi:hypothetical protein